MDKSVEDLPLEILLDNLSDIFCVKFRVTFFSTCWKVIFRSQNKNHSNSSPKITMPGWGSRRKGCHDLPECWQLCCLLWLVSLQRGAASWIPVMPSEVGRGCEEDVRKVRTSRTSNGKTRLSSRDIWGICSWAEMNWRRPCWRFLLGPKT